MACLGSVLYDPGTAATVSTAALLAMTAMDTTNARVTFTCPANGNVLVKIRVGQKGAATNPQILLGVLDGATVRGRSAPVAHQRQGSTNLVYSLESVFLVTGLTPGNSYTFDAAYGVEFAVALTTLGWGGPNNTTANDAYGALSFEVWETTNLLAGKNYDPGTAVANKAVSSTLAMTAFDTTNLRHTFTVPASGRVSVRLRCMLSGGTGAVGFMLGVLESTTVRMRQHPIGGYTNFGTLATTDHAVYEAQAVVGGLTPAANLTWDAAYGVELVLASTNIKYGGPNNTTQDDAYGGFVFEVWSC